MEEQDRFLKVYDEYFDLVGAVISKHCFDPVLLEDVAQEVWMHIHSVLGKYKETEDGTFKAWLCSVARNKTIDILRSRNIVVAGDCEIQESTIYNAGPSPEQQAISRNVVDCINEALVEGSDICVAFRLRYLNGFTMEETANRCGVHINTIKKRLAKAHKQLVKHPKIKEILAASSRKGVV